MTTTHHTKPPRIKLKPHGKMKRRVYVTVVYGVFSRKTYLADATVEGLSTVLDRQTAIDAYTLFHAIK